MTLQGEWVPEDEHLEGDAITMRAALRTSSNRAAVRMLEEVGIPATVRYAEQLGVGSVPNVPSLALGSGEVTLLSMTSAFGAFANEGMLAQPVLVRQGRNHGRRGAVPGLARGRAGGQRSDGVPDQHDAGRRDQHRDGVAGEARGFHAAGRGQDRDDQRLSRCLVRRLHADARLRRVGGLRPAADDHRQRLCRRHRGAALGPVHGDGDAWRQAGMVRARPRPSPPRPSAA